MNTKEVHIKWMLEVWKLIISKHLKDSQVSKGHFTLHRQTVTNLHNHQITKCHFSGIPRPDKHRFNMFNLQKQAQTNTNRRRQHTGPTKPTKVSVAIGWPMLGQCEVAFKKQRW